MTTVSGKETVNRFLFITVFFSITVTLRLSVKNNALFALYNFTDDISILAVSLKNLNFSLKNNVYNVTWNNWDDSEIYTERYEHGKIPAFYDRYGESRDIPVRPEDDIYTYVFKGWDKMLDPVTEDITYTAIYDAIPKEFLVTVEPTENGRVTPGTDAYMTNLDNRTYTFLPNVGYKVKDVVVNGVSVGAVKSYTVSGITGDTSIRVEFEKIEYSVSVKVGDNGSADISDTVSVEHGSGIKVDITPNEGFAVDYVKVNGLLTVITSDTLELENITRNTRIEIAFKQSVFDITTESDENGEITPTFSAQLGESATVKFTPKFGYVVKDVKIDGNSIGATDSYTFDNVDGAHTVSVEYEINKTLIVIAVALGLVLLVTAIIIAVKIKKRRRHIRFIPCPPVPHI